jgi:glycosyltransferase involved in cell wall biosynthesis
VALAAQGVAVRALAPSAPGLPPTDTLSGIPVTRFRYAPAALETLAYGGTMIAEARRTGGLALLGFLAAARQAAAREIRRHGAQVMHAHWWFPAGLSAASVARIPLVTTMHGTDVRMARAVPFSRPAFRWVMRRSAVCTTVSSWLADSVKALAPAADPQVAPMPAATELFTSGKGNDRDPGLVLFVGRLNAQKGARHLLDAVARMRTPARVRLIGHGPDAEALRRQADALGIAGRLEWLPGMKQHALAAQYRQAGVVVVPSREEGLGMVAVEAQLCGAAVIASASGGLPDVVEDGRTGLLVPPADPGRLANALDDLLESPARAAALGEAGRQSALARFAPEAVAARYAGFYRQACGAR